MISIASCLSAVALTQVEEWNRDQIVRFWQRWYFPANTTLYLVGDFGQSVEDSRRLIERTFGSVPAVRAGHELIPHVFGRPPQNGATAAAAQAPLKKRHEVGMAHLHHIELRVASTV